MPNYTHAKSEHDLVEVVKVPRRRIQESQNRRIREGQIIQDAWNELRRASVRELCKRTGYSVARVMDHVNHRIDKGQAKVVVTTTPDTTTAPLVEANLKKTDVANAETPVGISYALEETQLAPEAVDLDSPSPGRVPTTVHRIIRDTELARRVKQLHNFECQICGLTIALPDGNRYAEAHHIQPLGQPHNGPDEVGNILCLCPNHHAELDFGVIQLSLSKLPSVEGHEIKAKFVDYHNSKVCPK